MNKKLVGVVLSVAMVTAMLVGCGRSEERRVGKEC